jgi:hypothetical protein
MPSSVPADRLRPIGTSDSESPDRRESVGASPISHTFLMGPSARGLRPQGHLEDQGAPGIVHHMRTALGAETHAFAPHRTIAWMSDG